MMTPFPEAFQSLTDFPPMRWQYRLFRRFVDNDLPSACDIPTGLGKTSIIVIWLLALAHQAKHGRIYLPRRLIYIVNRRTVVDQATDTVERIRHRLLNPDKPEWHKHAESLRGVASVLCGLRASEGSLLAVSTLRGELADNEQWNVDPARPAIAVGTIDMIGSKLLFSGYGEGRYLRAQHAGLIGQDTLIVHDEAHLTPAFSELLLGIVDAQERSQEPRRVRILELSATQRTSGGKAFRLDAEDEADKLTGRVVKERLDARKWLRLHHISEDVAKGLVDLAKRHTEHPAKVLVYVRSPDDAQRVAELLKKDLSGSDGDVAVLTGTIRGRERDRLVQNDPVIRALLDHTSAAPRTVFLISTSAGEVGLDLDADCMVCDLTTLDSMIQRLGRVNRRGGEGREARVDMVWTDEDVEDSENAIRKAAAKTLQVLQKWVHKENANAHGLLVSPRNLGTLIEGLSAEEREAAFSPKPAIAPLTHILLDNWSMTSIGTMPGRPEVAAYLHGLTVDPPETFVVWRAEVRLFANLRPARADLSQDAVRGPRGCSTIHSRTGSTRAGSRPANGCAILRNGCEAS